MMKPAQPINISFEFYPPKTEEGIFNLQKCAVDLTKLAPEFFSVTFGAGGSTREGTIETVQKIHLQTGMPVAPHLACMGLGREEIISIIEHYKSLGVKRIIALRGDLPSGMGKTGELQFANELVALIREKTDDYFHIEVAAYPEFHPQAKSVHEDMANFKKKIDAGANSAITQYFFNADAYFYFHDDCAKHNIFVPIVPGIMPITQFAKLVRFSSLCGAEIPRWIYKRLESYQDDNESIQAFGFEVVCNLCERLLEGGAPGLHFYTLNHAASSIKIVNTLMPQKKVIYNDKEDAVTDSISSRSDELAG
jgi:methylenetetrahydrofolate reductase (NADPH)